MKTENVVTSPKQRYTGIKMVTTLLCLVALILLTLLTQLPPKPQASDNSEQVFSSERAMKHLQQVAAEIHPTGSQANEKVRQYLVEQLNQLDMNPKVDTYNGFIETPYFSGNIELHNIIGIVKGTGDGKAIMLSAHYDSVATGPGANDNGVAVAALLETARALKAGTSLKNDVWVVLTDAEEQGLIGAEVFWRNEEYRQKIGLIANFEARGSKGSSMMFQTSDDNGKLIREFAQNPPHPLANSFMGDLYKKLPNDTDFTISLKAGIPGFNFAYIDGWETYHTPEDNLNHVDGSSLQHHGENALYIANNFGNVDLSNLDSTNEVYFSFFGTLIHYPQSIVGPLTALVTILFIGLVVVANKKGIIRLRGISFSLLLVVLCVVVSAVISLGLWFGIYTFWADSMTLFNGYTYHANLYNLSFLLVTMVVNTILLNLFDRKINEMEIMMAGMLLCLLLLFVSALYLPGASYLLTLPLLVHSLVIGFALIRPEPLAVLNHPMTIVLTALLPVILFTTVFHLLFIGLPPLVNIVGVLLLSLLLALLHPANKLLMGAPRLSIPAALVVIVILIGTGWFHAINPSPDYPVYQDEKSTQKN